MADKLSVSDALAMLVEIFEEPDGSIDVDSAKDDIEGWDSLGVLSLMAELDERFEILLQPEDIEGFVTVNDLFKVLRSHGVLMDE